MLKQMVEEEVKKKEAEMKQQHNKEIH